jgi:hypothetical protein
MYIYDYIYTKFFVSNWNNLNFVTTRENQNKIPGSQLTTFHRHKHCLHQCNIVLETPCPICYFRVLKEVSLPSNKFVRSSSRYYWLYEIAKYVSVLSSSIIMITQICVKVSHMFQRLKRRSQQNYASADRHVLTDRMALPNPNYFLIRRRAGWNILGILQRSK